MRLPASLFNCFKVFPGWVAGHPDMIKLSVVMTVLLHYWSYLITVCSLLVAMLYMFTCFQGNHQWIYSLLQLFCPLYPWRTHGSLPSVLVHCCQRLRFVWHLQVIWNGRASYRNQSCDLRVWEQCEASTRGMNKSISTMAFPISNNSFMVSWTILLSWWTGPSPSRGRKTVIYQCLDINDELSWSKSSQRVILLLQSLILMTRTLCD